MKIQNRPIGRTLCLALLLVVLIASCSSQRTTIVPMPPENMQKLGRVEGKAYGTIFQMFFSIFHNSRTDRAYADALAKAPGATALIDVTLQEDWLWYSLGTFSILTISGEAVR
ncbi:MAG: hypothetical protein KKC46_10125 [Proteobacteria bacterium]|nr:hypothetical protein [Pseudomonadota bacterium]